MGMASGIGSFWFFVAIVIVAVTWRKIAAGREAQATIRLAIEKGQPLDPAVIDRILPSRDENGLLIPGAVLLAVGVGLPVMGYVIALGGAGARNLYPTLGAGILIGLMGLAFMIVWFFTRKPRSDSGTDRSRT
jgi:hypothetical protein